MTRLFFWLGTGTVIILAGPLMAALADISFLLLVLLMWLVYYGISSLFLSNPISASLSAYLLVGISIFIFSQTKYGGFNLSYSEFKKLLKS